MIKCATPKQVTLANGRTFTARFKHATRADLPANVCLERFYKQGPAPKGKRRRPPRLPRHGGRGFNSVLGKLFHIAKKVGKSKAFKNIARAGINEVPGLIDNLSKKVKNKRLKSVLNSYVTKTGLDLAVGYAMDKLK